MTNKQSYQALRIRQSPDAADLILFGAAATDIDEWSGIPQREKLGKDAEAVGFQREENEKRVGEVESFLENTRNVIQNPLLCASRDEAKVKFEALNEDAAVTPGTLTIEWEDLSSLPLLELLRRVRLALEIRLPELADMQVDEAKIARLKARANSEHPDVIVEVELEDSQEDNASATEDPEEISEIADLGGDGDAVTSVLFSEQTHIADFWEEVVARISLLEEAGDFFDGTSFLGFAADAMVSYLQPIVVVDGQHRLRGALLAVDQVLRTDALQAEIEAMVESDVDADEIIDKLRRREARQLPVSLLMDTSPAEHVFQFVVVNQKATPIGRALLGTIVSTSLSAEELEPVRERLDAAGIPLEDSQAIAYLTRHPSSPFCNLVERGLADEGNNLLQWSVLGSLVRIFRELKGASLYHERLDYADKWRRDQLDVSGIVSAAAGDGTKLSYWSQPNGPWREVFIAFWTAVRDRLATTDDEDAGNFWGSPRTSNLFNKISLTILTADFFQYMVDRGIPIDSAEDVGGYVDDWLRDVKATYFSRNWKLVGVRKDSPGTRAQWASLWVQYRKDPQQLPQVRQFRQPKA